MIFPYEFAAWRCEESSNFGGRCHIGSGLAAGTLQEADVADLVALDGKFLREIFIRRGYSLQPDPIRGVSGYLELHIEQGRVLEEGGDRLGIVGVIAGPRRFSIHIEGMADHSGATPMGLRQDALCAAAQTILAVERIGREKAQDNAVATVGAIYSHPNVINSVPGHVELRTEFRAIRETDLDKMEAMLRTEIDNICTQRNVYYRIKLLDGAPPVCMSLKMQDALCVTAQQMGIPFRKMVSGAGHDAMELAKICEAAMVFVPCRQGISHNPKESAQLKDILEGAQLLFQYIKQI